MLRAYRPGDAPKLIAWKALAREQGLLTKEFSAMRLERALARLGRGSRARHGIAPVGARPMGHPGGAVRAGLRPAHPGNRRSRPIAGKRIAPAAWRRWRSSRRMKKARAASPHLDVRNVAVAPRRDGLRRRAPPARACPTGWSVLRRRGRVARLDRVGGDAAFPSRWTMARLTVGGERGHVPCSSTTRISGARRA